MISAEQREAIRTRLAEIEAANGGRLTAAAVVQDAKRKSSPLHSCFEWDIRKAAESHWIEQARELITSVRVVVQTEHTKVNAVYYVRDPTAENQEQGYVSIKRLRGEREMARDALIAEFSRVADMLRRAREMAVVLDSQNDVEKLLQGVVGLRQRFIEAVPAQQ
jgi:hypothetical protein